MKQIKIIALCIIGGFLLISCNISKEQRARLIEEQDRSIQEKQPLQPIVRLEAFEKEPTQWGEKVQGVKTQFVTSSKEVALTFDACGGELGNGYDEELISFLQAEKIPATLFVNKRWIEANSETFLTLAKDPLFQIENHGSTHRPLSVKGGEAYGIPATASPKDAYEEIMINHREVERLTGQEMSLFRSGTAHYDEIAVELAEALGYKVVNFDILGDAGATYCSAQVEHALLDMKPGSIALLHMNQPKSETAEGVKKAIPKLKEKGFTFVQLRGKSLK